MNPASRLFEIFECFSASPGTEIQAVWANYLGIGPLPEEQLISISQAVIGEVKATQSRLADLGIESELFHLPAEHLRVVFSPLRLSHNWAQFMNADIALKTRHALLWARWALNKFDEDDLPTEQVEALRGSLAAQEALLAEIKLPFALRELLERQVRELKTAMLLYRVSGAAPLADAVNKHIGEMRHVSNATVKEYEEGTPEVKTAVEKAGELIVKAAKVADIGSKIFKFGENAYKYGSLGWELAKKIAE